MLKVQRLRITQIPFHRTVKMAPKRGFEKTVFIASAILLESFLLQLQRLRYLPKNGTIVKVNNSKMLLFPKNGAIHKDLFLNRKREIMATDYLIGSGVIKKGDVVLDVGANIGYYVLIESQLVGANGKVYAVEPVQDNRELLKKNLQLNNVKNVDTFQLAFGECNEESEIYVSSSCNLSSMNKNTAGGKIIGVQCITKETVDTFLKNKPLPSFIRMDVEGYEYEIFKGMTQTLKGDLKILVELHANLLHEKIGEIFKILIQNNFKVRFAAFEGKGKQNKVVDYLWQKGGIEPPTLNFAVENVSIKKFQKIMKDHPNSYPNVLFEKQNGQ